MPIFNQPSRTTLWLVGAAALLGYGALGYADSATAQRERQRTYQSDRQRCPSGQTGQSQTSCLQEAAAVLHQTQSQQAQASATEWANNAVQRCEAFTGDDRQSCVLRIPNPASVQGSVESGGILRELSEPAT